MNEVIEEWVRKAEGDYRTALREMAVTEGPNYDAICFHAQQCIEKLVKAALIAQGIVPPKSHDLPTLCQMLPPRSVAPAEALAIEDLRYLTRAAVAFRYPGESAERGEAEDAVEICTRLREVLLNIIKD